VIGFTVFKQIAALGVSRAPAISMAGLSAFAACRADPSPTAASKSGRRNAVLMVVTLLIGSEIERDEEDIFMG
jgi:hypothetical protein